MTKLQYLFISRKSSHYLYYQKLVSYLGPSAELHQLKRFVVPRLQQLQKVNKLDINDLVDVHIRRKEVRHPVITKWQWLKKIVRSFYLAREKARASYYFSLYESHPCETVILWNGMKQPNRTPYIVAKAAGKKVMLFENGLLPNTTVLDPKGVNAVSSVPRDKTFYTDSRREKVDLPDNLVVRAPHKNRGEQSKVSLPQQFIFVPFQVPNDTQVVCHSPWVKSMEHFFSVLEDALNFLQSKSTAGDYKFVIKEHPSWPRNFEQLYNRNPSIMFANEHNTQELITKAKAVITINSTIGLESLLFNKKVITVGNSFLNIDGLVQHCSNQDSLNNALLTIDTFDIDENLKEQFLAFISQEYLLPGAWHSVNEQDDLVHFEAVKERLNKSFKPY